MAVVTVLQTDTFEQWRQKTNQVSSRLGDEAGLTTTETDLVAAINALRDDTGYTALTTTAGTITTAINELDAFQGNESLTTTAQTISGAVNELDALQGDVALPTTASTVTGAIDEHETDIGTVGNLNTTATDLTAAINEVKVTADDAQAEIGGDMSADYDGDDTTIISALNNLFAASSVSTLNDAYLRRDGVGAMEGVLTVDALGIDSDSNSLLLKTNGSTRITVNTSGNVGIGKAPSSYKVDVSGSVNASTLRYNGEDTDTRYLRAGGVGDVTDITVPVNFQAITAVTGDFTIGSEVVFVADDYTFTEFSQDLVGNMFTSNSESGGISAVYNDSTGKITLAIANNAHNHVSTNITDFTEAVEDVVGSMVGSNTENGVSVTYNDSTGKLNFDVNDPVITISGEASGSATMTNLGDTDISLTLSREVIQDHIGTMLSGNTENGITVTYDDENNEIDFDVNDPVISLTGDVSGSATMTNLSNTSISTTVSAERIQDVVGSMFSGNSESGINATYQDGDGTIDLNVNDPTISISGEATGSATMTNLGSVDIDVNISTNAVQSRQHLLKVYDVNNNQVFP